MVARDNHIASALWFPRQPHEHVAFIQYGVCVSINGNLINHYTYLNRSNTARIFSAVDGMSMYWLCVYELWCVVQLQNIILVWFMPEALFSQWDPNTLETVCSPTGICSMRFQWCDFLSNSG